MDSAQFREAARTAIDEITDYYDNVSSQRVVSDVKPGYLRPLLPSSAPLEGESWTDIHADIESKTFLESPIGPTPGSWPSFHAQAVTLPH
ncbi:hypothetical protein NW765_013818 [Fusarium oxysporum]|nr:hypothetical protein NW765_013818 [Fusarium oxysporum]